jgi:hypothetical protein
VDSTTVATAEAASVLPSSNPSGSMLVPSPSVRAASDPPGELIEVDSLPRLEFDPSWPLTICDPDPAQADSDADDTTLPCIDAIPIAFAAIADVIDGSVTRLYLRRPPCPKSPCTREALDTALVTGWFDGGSITVAIDSRLDHVRVTRDGPDAAWPRPPPADPPASKPIGVPGAPREVRNREPFPSCGMADLAEISTGAPDACFLKAMIEGRPAEFLEFVYGTEGGRITWFYRYSGTGPVVRYRDHSGTWSKESGQIIVNPPGGRSSWSFDPWWGTDSPVR